MQDLEKLREQIDTLDDKILSLLAKRRSVSAKIADVKAKSKLRSRDFSRWQSMLEQRLSLSDTLDLPRAFVKKMFMLIHDDSVALQDELLKK